MHNKKNYCSLHYMYVLQRTLRQHATIIHLLTIAVTGAQM